MKEFRLKFHNYLSSVMQSMANIPQALCLQLSFSLNILYN
jgi:hypothetical protein